MGEETEDSRFLGCNLTSFTATADDVMELLQSQPQVYERPKAGKKRGALVGAEPSVPIEPDPKREIRGTISEMEDFTDDCVAQYCTLTGITRESTKPASTPFVDESKDPLGVTSDVEDLTKERATEIGQLAKIARKVLMKNHVPRTVCT